MRQIRRGEDPGATTHANYFRSNLKLMARHSSVAQPSHG
jgi:hypothetical protein